MAHSVTNRLGLQAYLPAVRAFLEWARDVTFDLREWEGVDAALSCYLAYQCYVGDRHPNHGAYAVNGLVYVYPQLPRAWRALKARQSMSILGEGDPVPLEVTECMCEYFFKNKGQREQKQHV